MNLNQDVAVINFFFKDIEAYREIFKLEKALQAAIVSYVIKGNVASLKLKGEVDVVITKNPFEENRIDISDVSFYLNNEDKNSKVSIERICYYLLYICNVMGFIEKEPEEAEEEVDTYKYDNSFEIDWKAYEYGG